MKKENKRQKELDALKEKVGGKGIIKWEDVKRKEGSNSLYDLPWLDKSKGTSLATINTTTENQITVRNNFLEDLDKQLQPGRNINEYRELKTFLVEQSSLIEEKTGLRRNDLQDKLEKLDDLIVETNTIRYEDAAERLSDDEGFAELEQLRKEYHQSIETLALETVVQDKKQIEGAKVNLLDILRGE